jgi:hypothetical protein
MALFGSWDFRARGTPLVCFVMIPTLNCAHQSCNFTMVDRAISLIVALHGTANLLPRLLVDERSVMSKLVNRLLKYLRPNFTVYHVRSVTLIWSLQNATSRSHVESILAQTMNTPESRNVQEAYEAFGVLWRLTGRP